MANPIKDHNWNEKFPKEFQQQISTGRRINELEDKRIEMNQAEEHKENKN